MAVAAAVVANCDQLWLRPVTCDRDRDLWHLSVTCDVRFQAWHEGQPKVKHPKGQPPKPTTGADRFLVSPAVAWFYGSFPAAFIMPQLLRGDKVG